MLKKIVIKAGYKISIKRELWFKEKMWKWMYGYGIYLQVKRGMWWQVTHVEFLALPYHFSTTSINTLPI